ncbi:universal stress protein [Natronococcus pandeyae]|uniref:Universal stress protein n=1 Tax=Natronococcus pandeyae TaxID=2055836 RepID=A0A8J8TQ91_9EURY|nr:universal stress protein [Natronococcus pandeyae]TYL36489.1 universal stress protein [Natronococcus pandeyae]
MTSEDAEQGNSSARENYQDILVPTDGSNESQQAAERGIEIAAALDATVHALSVVEGSATLKRDQLRVNAEQEAEKSVDQVVDEAERMGVDVVTAVELGIPHETINEYALENDVDMIVMGTHGRTGLDHVLIGSIAERVVRTSPVPVLTVRPSE